MKYIGAMLVISSVMLFFYSLYKRREERLLLEKEALRLVLHIKRELSCFSRPIKDALLSFESEMLSKKGFYGCIRESNKIKLSVLEFFKREKLSHNALSILERYFMSGSEYLSSESDRITLAAREYSEYLEHCLAFHFIFPLT